MVHIALCYTEIAAGLDEEEEDIMVTRRMIDSDRFEDLKQARVGKSQRKKCVEYGNWPTSEVVEIVISRRSKRSRPIDAWECVVFTRSYLPSEVGKCIQLCRARTLTMEDIDLSVFAWETGEYHSLAVDTDFPEHDRLEWKHIIWKEEYESCYPW